MVTLQNLQNFANLQNLPHVASLAAGLQSMSGGLSNSQLINTPLNLTVSSSGRFFRPVVQCVSGFAIEAPNFTDEQCLLYSWNDTNRLEYDDGAAPSTAEFDRHSDVTPAAFPASTGGDAPVHTDVGSTGPGYPGRSTLNSNVTR